MILFIVIFCRKSPDVQLSIKISFAWYLKNYVRVCHLIQQLSPLLICAAMISIQKLRRYMHIYIYISISKINYVYVQF